MAKQGPPSYRHPRHPHSACKSLNPSISFLEARDALRLSLPLARSLQAVIWSCNSEPIETPPRPRRRLPPPPPRSLARPPPPARLRPRPLRRRQGARLLRRLPARLRTLPLPSHARSSPRPAAQPRLARHRRDRLPRHRERPMEMDHGRPRKQPGQSDGECRADARRYREGKKSSGCCRHVRRHQHEIKPGRYPSQDPVWNVEWCIF